MHKAAIAGKVAELKELIASGSDINALDHRSYSAAHKTLKHHQQEAFTILVNAKANLDTRNYFGSSLLHDAARYDNVDAILTILAQGVDINTKNSLGATPLHVAANNGCAKAVRLLVENGADMDIEDKRGNIPEKNCRWHRDLPPLFAELRKSVITEHILTKCAAKKARSDED